MYFERFTKKKMNVVCHVVTKQYFYGTIKEFPFQMVRVKYDNNVTPVENGIYLCDLENFDKLSGITAVLREKTGQKYSNASLDSKMPPMDEDELLEEIDYIYDNVAINKNLWLCLAKRNNLKIRMAAGAIFITTGANAWYISLQDDCLYHRNTNTTLQFKRRCKKEGVFNTNYHKQKTKYKNANYYIEYIVAHDTTYTEKTSYENVYGRKMNVAVAM